MKAEHIFIIDDDKFFAKYFIKKLELLSKQHVEFHHFLNVKSVFNEDKTLLPVLIFVDDLLNNARGVDALPALHERFPNAELILISGTDELDIEEKALKNGATKYISKITLLFENVADSLDKEIKEMSQRTLLSRLFKS